MKQYFVQRFKQSPEIASSSPGRINLIGEHTDYNDGYVMPGAIDKRITFLVARGEVNDRCRVHSVDLDSEFEFSLKNLERIEGGGWKNYIIGVVAELQAAGAKIESFDALFHGDVPLGAGLSSSAALECALAKGLNDLFSLDFTQTQLIKIAQMAEHHYAGVACGIMDQFASVMGKKGHVFRLDCRSLEYTYFPMELGEYELVLLDTRVEHSLTDSAYNERRSQCEEGVKLLKELFPQIESLRGVTPVMLAQGQSILPELIYQRCHHVVHDNMRVLQASEAIIKMDMEHLGKLLYQSHDSLSGSYEVSCSELDFLVDFTRNRKEVLGARMMGGGFGGCTLNLIRTSEKTQFISEIVSAYLKETGIHLKEYAVSLADGASSKSLMTAK